MDFQTDIEYFTCISRTTSGVHNIQLADSVMIRLVIFDSELHRQTFTILY